MVCTDRGRIGKSYFDPGSVMRFSRRSALDANHKDIVKALEDR